MSNELAAPAVSGLLAVGLRLLTDLQFLNDARFLATKTGGVTTLSEESLSALINNTKANLETVLEYFGIGYAPARSIDEGIVLSLAKQRAEADADSVRQREIADKLMESAKLDPTKMVTP